MKKKERAANNRTLTLEPEEVEGLKSRLLTESNISAETDIVWQKSSAGASAESNRTKNTAFGRKSALPSRKPTSQSKATATAFSGNEIRVSGRGSSYFIPLSVR